MPNPTLNWRMLAPVIPSPANTTVGWLDAINTALTAVTYNDGSARVPGTGSAWTATRYQNAGVTEAVYASPPTVTAVAQRVIFGGSQTVTPSPSPTMTLNETYTNGNIMVGLNLDSGAFNAWNAALPFTSGRFTGYTRLRTISAATWVRMYLWESQECLAVQFVTSTGATTVTLAGAIIDPLQGGAAAESDGRFYAISSSGSGQSFDPNWQNGSAAVIGYLYLHSGVAGNCKCVGFNAATRIGLNAVNFFSGPGAGPCSTAATSLTGLVPTYSTLVVTQFGSPNVFIGMARAGIPTRRYLTGLTLQVGGVDVGYTLGAQDSPAAAADTLFLPK